MQNNFDSLVELQEHTVHIWNISFDINDHKFQSYFKLLSKEEKVRAHRFRFFKDKKCFVVTRATLRLISSHYLSKEIEDIVFEYEDYGKPYFKHNTDLNFNVSHSGNRAVIGFVHHHTIGIDIEKIKNDFDTFEIASNFFSKAEIDALRNIPKAEQYLAFYRCWTRKEAFIKAKGSGLSFPLDTFSVSLDSDLEASLLYTKWNPLEKDEWKLTSFIPGDGYIAALITDKQVKSVEYFDWRHN